jgi:hypothetical protein
MGDTKDDNKGDDNKNVGPDEEAKGVLRSIIGEVVEEKLNAWAAKNTPKQRTTQDQPTFLQSLFGQY